MRCHWFVWVDCDKWTLAEQEQEVQRLRDGHGEGGAPWLRAELEAKSCADLRKLCAKFGVAQRRGGATLRSDQPLESIVDSFSSQEGLC